MTENEIKELKRRVKENKVLTFNERKYINNALEEIQQYRAIGTVEEFKDLKEKNVAKKPTEIIKNEIGFYHCPHCKNTIGTSIMTYQSKHCSYCGQLLDWND